MIYKSFIDLNNYLKEAAKGTPSFLFIESQEPLCLPFMEMLSEKLEKHENVKFLTERKVFTFNLRFCEPSTYFNELHQYVYELQDAGGFHGDFKGLVAVDLSEWCGQEDAEYLDAFLAYIHDHNEGLYFVFGINEKQHHHAEHIYKKLTEYFHIKRAEINLFHREILVPYMKSCFELNSCQVPDSIVEHFAGVVEDVAKGDFSFNQVKLLCEEMLDHSCKKHSHKVLKQAYIRYLSDHLFLESNAKKETSDNFLGILFAEERGK